MQPIEIVVVCAAVVSCVSSLIVITTILTFKEMRRGNFMRIILYMSLSDFAMNLSSAIGFPPDGSIRCWMQGMLQIYFAVSSWLWTTVLAYRIYCIVKFGICYLKNWHSHIICWGIPLMLTLLPLTTSKYGTSSTNTQWCLLVRKHGSPDWTVKFWGYLSYFVWLFLCITLMIGMQLCLYIKFRNSSIRAVVIQAYDKVYLYPIAMSACWILNYSLTERHRDKHSSFLAALSMIFGISNGIISSMIFLVKSTEARKRWHRYFFSTSNDNGDDSNLRTNGLSSEIELDFDDDYDVICEVVGGDLNNDGNCRESDLNVDSNSISFTNKSYMASTSSIATRSYVSGEVSMSDISFSTSGISIGSGANPIMRQGGAVTVMTAISMNPVQQQQHGSMCSTTLENMSSIA